MNISSVWRKTELEQKSDRERWGDGGGGGGGGRKGRERERACWALEYKAHDMPFQHVIPFHIFIYSV